jgi:hypothetical protein
MTRLAVAQAWESTYTPPDERAREMGRLYAEEGQTYEEIGEIYGVTRQRVAQILSPFGFTAHYGKRKRTERAQVLREIHARIQAGETTLAEQGPLLGYADGESLRHAMLAMNLRFPRPPSPEHGAAWRYNKGCHCPECTEAYRVYVREKRGKREARTHGTPSSYINYGCRCQACREAAARYRRDLKARRRQEQEVET